MSPDLALNMMVFTVTFSEEDEWDVFENRHYLLMNWMEHLAESGVRFDQFVITSHETDTESHEYHVSPL